VSMDNCCVDVDARKLANLEKKANEFRRFRSKYQAMTQENKAWQEAWDRADRDNAKLARALSEIANADNSFRRKHMIDYAEKVLAGLGY
jgi:hypothetical protein